MKLIPRVLAVFLVIGLMLACSAPSEAEGTGQATEQGRTASKEHLASLVKKAEQGDVGAQHFLGLSYDLGRGVPQDYKQAVYWYTKAAEQGDASAQVCLGVMYAQGLGVLQDYKQAVYWYTKAAEQGKASAQYMLGFRYCEGQGVLQDYAKAYAWWNLAASQGYKDARKNRDIILGKMSPGQIEEGQKLSRELNDKINSLAK